MAWESLNLADAMSGVTAKANDAIAQAQKGLSKINKQVTELTSGINAITSAAASSKSFLDKLQEAGFYMIVLSPGAGAWDTRLAGANNSPPTTGFCTGTANILIAANIDTVTNGFNKVKEMMMKPVDDVKKFIDTTDFSDFLPDPLPTDLADIPDESLFAAKSWDDAFAPNAWHAAKLGDVFGGAMSGMASNTGKIIAAGKAANSQLNQFKKLSSAASKGLNTVQNFMADAAATGTYNIMLPPATGGYLTRLRTEVGAPPSDSLMYSAGFVCITTAPSIDSLLAKYDSISKLVKGI